MLTWNIGNTTIRNPERIREALKLFVEKMSGRPFGLTEQLDFQRHMIEAGLVDSKRYDGDDGARKFASAFKQLGFVTDWARGTSWHVTSVGQYLIDNPGVEDIIFLRQLLKYQLPSPLETRGTASFSLRPFWMLLKFLMLARTNGLVGLTKHEIGIFVITTLTEDEDEFNKSFDGIMAFRNAYQGLEGKAKKSKFVADELASRASTLQIGRNGAMNPNTLLDYADSNSRYAFMSGLLSLKGNKLIIADSKIPLITELLAQHTGLIPMDEYSGQFYDPHLPRLPIDDPHFLTEETKTMLISLERLAEETGETFTHTYPDDPADILQLQVYEQQLRDDLTRIREIKYYRDQDSAEALQEIEETLTNIAEGTLVGGQHYAPAYFEWAIWRLFLAINHFLGPVNETRGFRIDEDMNPIHHAKGGAADLTFQYSDFVVVCEMTLMGGSQQFANEGEPVTRHVYTAISRCSGKPVYGLFFARKLDPNTADAFHKARYWKDWDCYIETPVVPLTIEHALVIVDYVRQGAVDAVALRKFIQNILNTQADFDCGPKWYESYKSKIENYLLS